MIINRLPPRVTEEAVRPAGKPDECFYCQQKIGQLHTPKCVTWTRKVMVQMTVEYPIEVPMHWTKEDIEFHRNEGTWCAGNALDELQTHIDETDDCGCSFIQFTFVGETQ